MRKVAIIAPNSLPIPPVRGGGVQTVIAETAPLFREYKPYIFSNCEYGIDDLPLKETAGKTEHRRICQSSWDEFKIKIRHLATKNYFPYIFEIINQIKEIQPDIIHLANRPWFLPILRKYLGSDIKIVLHHFNNYLMEMPGKKAKKHLDLIDGFIGCSQFTVDAEVIKRFPEFVAKCFVVSNGVDTDKFNPHKIKAETVASLKQKYDIKPDETVILYVGRLTEDKGAFELLEAIKTLVVNLGIRQVKLLIAGSSFFGGKTKITPFIKKLQKSSLEIKDNIIFTGYIDRSEIQNIFAVGDIAAVPSIVQDASPTVCYEASSMELPVVASTRGGIPEIVIEGQTGLLYDDPYDIDTIVEKLLYFIKDPAEKKVFGERGRALMEKNFTWKIVAGKIETVYNSVLGF
jgi:spore coat protein SA